MFLTLVAAVILTASVNAQLFGIGGKKRKEQIAKAFADYPNGQMPAALYNDVCLPDAEQTNKDLEADILKAFMKMVKRDGSHEQPKVVRIVNSDWRVKRDQYTGAILNRYVIAVIASEVGENKCISQGFNFYQQYMGTGYSSELICGSTVEAYAQRDIDCRCLDAKYTGAPAEANTKSEVPASTTEAPVETPKKEAPAAPAKTSASSSSTGVKAGTAVIDFAPIGIKATMIAPASVKAVNGAVKSLTGDNYFDIAVEETTMKLADLKAKVLADKGNRIISEKPQSFMYTTADAHQDVAHFECVVTIYGKTYRFHDKRSDKQLTPGQMMKMFQAVNTISEK